MALEQIFSCPATLAKLQRPPLGRILEDFCAWLVAHGFGDSTIRAHLSRVSHFNAYLGAHEKSAQDLITDEDVKGFFLSYADQCHNRGPLEQHLRTVHWSIARFVAFLSENGLYEQSISSPLYQPLLDAYSTWMQEQQHVTAGTLALRCHSISGFLHQLGAQATAEGLAQLSANQVEQLFLAQAQNMGQATRRSLQAAVRTFLRFCLARGNDSSAPRPGRTDSEDIPPRQRTAWIQRRASTEDTRSRQS